MVNIGYGATLEKNCSLLLWLGCGGRYGFGFGLKKSPCASHVFGYFGGVIPPKTAGFYASYHAVSAAFDHGFFYSVDGGDLFGVDPLGGG